MKLVKTLFAMVVAAWIAAFGMAASVSAQTATVSMRVDRTNVAVGETFELEIRADVQNGEVERIDVPALDAFEVLAQRSSRPMQFSFGFGGRPSVVQSTVVQQYTLRALREGRFSLRAARVTVGRRSFTSSPATVTVGPAASGGSVPLSGGSFPGKPNSAGSSYDPNANQPSSQMPPSGALDGATYDPQAFVRTVVDKPEPYVGEQVTVTMYLYVRSGLRTAPVPTREPTSDGFWVHDLLPPQRTLEATTQTVNGTPFRVYMLKRFAAFPLRAGELTLGSLRVTFETGSVFDMFGGGRGASQITRESPPVVVRARALPATANGPSTAIVGRFTIEASLDRTDIATGDAATLRTVVRGSGNLRDVQLVLPTIDGLEALAPHVDDAIASPGDLVGGTRTIEWLLVAKKPGTFDLGRIGFDAFDPLAETYSRIESTPLSLRAAGEAIVTSTASSGAGDADEVGAEDGPSWGSLHATSALERRKPPIARERSFLVALLAPPVLFFGALAFVAMLRRRNRRLSESSAMAARSSKKLLAEAVALRESGDARAFYASIGRAIRKALEARLPDASQGLAMRELRSLLAERGMTDELRLRLLEELEGCEFAQFSASSTDAAEMDRALERARALIARVEAFGPNKREAA